MLVRHCRAQWSRMYEHALISGFRTAVPARALPAEMRLGDFFRVCIVFFYGAPRFPKLR